MTFVKTLARSNSGAVLALLLVAAGCSDRPEWAARNQQVVDKAKVTGRTRELPAVTVPMILAPGVPVGGANMPTATIAPGVSASLGWGRGAQLERLDMQPGSVYPEQTLGEEPISLTFGGPGGDELYIVGGASAWSIQTKVRGFRHPGGLD
jgi:hypothetical protein